MKPVLVGVVGGAGSGKKRFSAMLVNCLRRRAVDAVVVECKSTNTCLPSLPDCILFHGLTLLEVTESEKKVMQEIQNPLLRRQLHLKVFLDVDADLRIANIMKRTPCPFSDIVRAHDFHVEHVVKQRKLADVWVEHINQEKVDQLVELILSLRRREQTREPEEVEVYLDKYDNNPDIPVAGDF